MLEFGKVAHEINEKLGDKNNKDLIMQVFLLGLMQGKGNPCSLEQLEQNLDIFINVNYLINFNIYKPQRIQKLYDELLLGSQNLEQISNKLRIKIAKKIEKASNDMAFLQQINQGPLKNTQNLQLENYRNIGVQSDDSASFQLEEQQQQKKNVSKVLTKQQQKQNKLDESKNLVLETQLKRQFNEENYLVKCVICLENIQPKEMMTLNCSHIFHQICLTQYCTNQIQSKQFPILCPSGCKKDIIYPDLRKILDGNQIQQFENQTLKTYFDNHADEFSWCPTPDCQYVFVLGGTSQFECPLCKKSYCLNCKTEYHKGLTCKKYQEEKKMESKRKNEKILDDQFLNFVKGAKYKQCPQCKFWVEKNQGCNHMTCRCKFEFCYVCGGVYKKCECVKKANRS